MKIGDLVRMRYGNDLETSGITMTNTEYYSENGGAYVFGYVWVLWAGKTDTEKVRIQYLEVINESK